MRSGLLALVMVVCATRCGTPAERPEMDDFCRHRASVARALRADPQYRPSFNDCSVVVDRLAINACVEYRERRGERVGVTPLQLDKTSDPLALLTSHECADERSERDRAALLTVAEAYYASEAER